MRAASKSWTAWALVGLTLLAFVERFAGLEFLLPHTREADTAMVHYAAHHDRPAWVEPNDAVYSSTVYPLLFPKILIALPGSNYPIEAPPDASLEAHLDAASEPYMRARRLMASLSLLVIPCTYWIARRWLERGWSLLAAALATTSSLALLMSPLAKPHGGLLGLTALALVGVLRLVRVRTLAAYLFAGLASALALGSLNSGVFIVLPLLLAHYLGWRVDRDKSRRARLAIALVMCAAMFVIAYPYVLFGDPLQSSSKASLNFGQQAIYWDTWGFQGFLDMIPALLTQDPTIVVLVIAAVVVFLVGLARGKLAKRDVLRPDGLVLGSFVLIFVVLFGLHERFFARYFLPILPIACVVGAAGLRALVITVLRRISSVVTRRIVAACASIAVLAFPSYASAWLATLRTRDDTAYLAARWLEAHVAPDSGPIAIEPLHALPLFQRPAAIREAPPWSWQPWQRYQVDVMTSAPRAPRWDLHPIFQPGINADHKIDRDEVRACLSKMRARWAVVTVPAPADAINDETCIALRELAGPPVARIVPFGPSGSIDSILTRDIDPEFLAHVLSLERLGPPIEIYRLP